MERKLLDKMIGKTIQTVESENDSLITLCFTDGTMLLFMAGGDDGDQWIDVSEVN